MIWDLIVIGGGASGFFGAIRAGELNPELKILILEQNKCLQKVRISGGGRCNLTHNQLDVSKLLSAYPRGNPELKAAFQVFGVRQTIEWFEKRGLKIKAEPDGRIFPITDDSNSVIQVLEKQVDRLKIRVNEGFKVTNILKKEDSSFEIETLKGAFYAKKVLISIGGGPMLKHWDCLRDLNLSCISPVPSLFTFNFPNEPLTSLMGLSVIKAMVSLPDLKMSFEGPLLITHWGISGPAVLKLSAFAAVPLASKGYNTPVVINWLPDFSPLQLQANLAEARKVHSSKTINNLNLWGLPKRLWEFLILKSGIDPDLKLASLGKKQAEVWLSNLQKDSYLLRGKTTYKEEFVTAGGIDLQEINLKTFEVKKVPNLFLAGEALNMDGITGGFNFQAAWASGFVAGTSIAQTKE